MERAKLEIGGMSCQHCVRAVDQALRGVAGIQVERVEVGGATVGFDPAVVDRGAITRAVEDEGYTVTGMEAVS
ncbi:MAG TPA: cation transporter [Longimicrobium sp.]|nr:cation transporter [Longimicrobium sp.]